MWKMSYFCPEGKRPGPGRPNNRTLPMTHRRTFPRPWLLAASLLLLMTGGCEKDDICPEGTLSTPRAKVLFYAFDDAGQAEEYPQTGLHFYGLQGTERLSEIGLSEGAKEISLPVDFEAEESRYLIEREGTGQTDTLTLRYTPKLDFLSKACGFRFVFSGVTVECTTEGPILEYVKDIEQHSVLVNEHELLLRAIYDGDSETAKRIMRTHLQNQQEGVIQAIQE